jgi:hypothetical protein
VRLPIARVTDYVRATIAQLTLQGTNKAAQSPWCRRTNFRLRRDVRGLIRRDNRCHLGFLRRGNHQLRAADFCFEYADRILKKGDGALLVH